MWQLCKLYTCTCSDKYTYNVHVYSGHFLCDPSLSEEYDHVSPAHMTPTEAVSGDVSYILCDIYMYECTVLKWSFF